MGRFLAEFSPDPDADAGADDPRVVTRSHVEAFQAWMIETRPASTALNKHKGLQQFFKWLLVEEEIDRSPMDRVRQLLALKQAAGKTPGSGVHIGQRRHLSRQRPVVNRRFARYVDLMRSVSNGGLASANRYIRRHG